MNTNNNILYLCILFVCTLAACNAADTAPPDIKPKTDLEASGLKGRVKSVIYNEYDIVYGTSPSAFGDPSYAHNVKQDENSYRFDSCGFMIQELKYNSSDKLEQGANYVIDSSHHVVESTYLTPGHETDTIVYRYNTAGLLTQELSYVGGHLKYREVYTYDSTGNKIRHDTYGSDNHPISYDTYRYDNRKNCIEEDNYFSDGGLQDRGLQQTTTYTWDKANRLITQRSSPADKKTYVANTYERDTKGRIVEEDYYKQYANSHVKEHCNYLYNKNGDVEANIVPKWYGGADDEKSRYIAYKYDSKGNQLEKTISKKQNGRLVPIKLITATIEYY